MGTPARGLLTFFSHNAIALVALFVALGGVSYAATQLPANSVGTKQLKKSAVTAAKIKTGAVTASKIKTGAVTGAKVAGDTITGTNVAEASLGKVPSAANADHATSADSVGDGAIGPPKFGEIPGSRVRNVSNQSVPSSSLTVLTFDTEDFDAAGLHSMTTDTSRLTASVAGRYLIMASGRWDNNTTGRRILIIRLNGSNQIARDAVSPNNTSGFGPEQTVETVYTLAAGEYVEVQAYQDSGAPLNVQANGQSSPVFSMSWLAP